ncbi:uncharacterized protein LOC120260068 [Dioscorea cayenensis subsp. rotundata]|uniref:Uncharacterized protein LOC120260068 n=1 Tax=Dioscorea cayennensis subsp. rotundata TaxID=55577 RepID=A0AB40B838_DIOCR|nr:uncharacterized protein LOC120260068 [Dioscorea cayenensis subsp. rotundata]
MVCFLNKLKENTSDFVKLDSDALDRARLRFQYSLFGKFFGKPPAFEQVKNILLKKWENIGEILISDLPNGFILLRCPNQTVLQRLLSEGPWTINGIILQLSPWRQFFEPTFTKLMTAAIWIQLHNLPIEFWSGDTLETITGHLGKLLKVDELTLSLTRTKYARVCIELDLSKPLSKGFWLGDDLHRKEVRQEHSPLVAEAGAGGICVSSLPANVSEAPVNSSSSVVDSDFGPWLLVSCRRGPSRSRGGSARTPTVAEGSAAATRQDVQSSRGASVHCLRGRMRGGASGRRHNSNATLHVPPSMVASDPLVRPDTAPLPVTLSQASGDSESHSPNVHRDSPPPPVISHTHSEKTPPITQPQIPYPKISVTLDRRHRSPPPVLLSSITESSILNGANPIPSTP